VAAEWDAAMAALVKGGAASLRKEIEAQRDNLTIQLKLEIDAGATDANPRLKQLKDQITALDAAIANNAYIASVAKDKHISYADAVKLVRDERIYRDPDLRRPLRLDRGGRRDVSDVGRSDQGTRSADR
jgi:predicted transport protein